MNESPGPPGMGTDALPDNIRHSKLFTPGNLAQLASVVAMPLIDPAYHDERLKSIFQYYAINPEEMETELQLYARELLETGQLAAAWQVLLSMV